MTLPNKVYDVLKYINLIAFPAAETLYFTLSKIWGFPFTVEILGTFAAIQLFFGALLGVSSATYNKGLPDSAEAAVDMAIKAAEEKAKKEETKKE